MKYEARSRKYGRGLIELLLFTLLLASYFLLPNISYAATLSRPANNLGLVGYWSFNEGSGTQAGDFSGNGNNGTLTNGPTWVNGRFGKALLFDGSTQHINWSSPLVTAAPFTVCAWFKADQLATTKGDEMQIWTSSDTVGGGSLKWFSMRIDDAVGNEDKVQVVTRQDGTIASFYTTSAITAQKWHHACYVEIASNSREVYLDAGNKGTDSTSVTPTGVDTTNVGILQTDQVPTYFDPFDGIIDEVRIYNRVLTATEIAALYQSGSAKFASSKTLTTGTTLADGLVGHWTFDGYDMLQNVSDVSGQGNNGNLQGQTSTTTVVGKLGQALSFDGVDDYVSTADIPFGGTNPISICAWINPSDVTHTHTPVVQSGEIFVRVTNPGKVEFALNSFTTNDRATSPSGTVSAGEWSHLCGTYATGGDITMYADGVSVANVTPTGSYEDKAADFYISPDDSQRFVGLIDDVRIYNRTLTASEVKQLYKLGAAEVAASSQTLTRGSRLSDGLVGHWTFDGYDMLQNVADVSGQGNNGSLQGQTSTSTVIGKLGQALSFGNGSSIDITSAITISAWIKTSGAAVTIARIVDKFTGAGVNGYMLSVGNNTGGVEDFLYFDVGGTSGFDVSGTSDIDDGEWHHVVGVNDLTNVFVYVDGVQENSDTGGAPQSDSNPLIGKNNQDATHNFVGIIDDVRIYNRALSASEIKQLYLMGK
jgi:hypothetical protein